MADRFGFFLQISDIIAKFTTMKNLYLESKPRYAILDGLRGVAAMMVVAFHLFETYSRGPESQIINHGYLAVDFFFVLSGFVIGYAYDDRWGKMSTWGFFKRRLVRLHPMVIAGSLIGMLLFYFGSSHLFPMIGRTPVWRVLLTFLFACLMIPLPRSMGIRGWAENYPLNGPQWSLLLEYLANILYVLIFRHMPKVLLGLCVLVAAFFTIDLGLDLNVFGLLGAHAEYTFIGGWGVQGTQLYIGLIRLFYPFLCGLLLSRIGRFIKIRGAFWWCSAVIVILLALPRIGSGDTAWLNGLYESLCILVAFPLLVAVGAGSATTDARSTKICRFLGEISFPLYITHYPLVYMQMAWKANNADAPLAVHVMVGVCTMALAIMLAWAMLKLYDIPVRAWLKEKWLKKKSCPTAP